jgi:hypothetical protein
VAPRVYRIVVEGELGPRFEGMFGDLDVRCAEGRTTIVGPIEDQAQLHGVIDALEGLGVTLLGVAAVEEDEPASV